MPEADAHRRQRKKNLLLFAILVMLVGLFYGLTMVKMSNL
jgi:hypothetical protein